MATKIKLNDLDYCYASWLLLKDLEELSYSRNEYIRNYRQKENARISVISTGIALIFPIILWVELLFFSGGIHNVLSNGQPSRLFMRLLGLIFASALLFIIVFFILRLLWYGKLMRPLKKRAEKSLKLGLIEEIKKIDHKVEDIVYRNIFEENRIPEKFLDPPYLMMIIRYFENGQAIIMKEAVYALELELKNTGHYRHLVTGDTILKKEKNYLSDKKGNLERIIYEGENQ